MSKGFEGDKNVNDTPGYRPEAVMVSRLLRECGISPYRCVDTAFDFLREGNYTGTLAVLDFLIDVAAVYYCEGSDEGMSFIYSIKLFRHITQCYGREFRDIVRGC